MSYRKINNLSYRLIGAFLVLLMLSACVTQAKYGVPPKVERLSGLKVGVSKQADVLMALGEPRGKGAARLSDAKSQQLGIAPYHDIWFYEYAELKDSHAYLKFLLVFIDKDTYNGHLWFSSSDLLKVER